MTSYNSNVMSLQAIIERVFPGRGGGLALLINSVTMVTINVTSCKFQSNFATSAGGGAYVGLAPLSSHVITFQSCDFEDNLAGDYGGGMEVEFGQNGNETFPSHIMARDCHFLHNEAQFGGAVYVGMCLPIDVCVSTCMWCTMYLRMWCVYSTCRYLLYLFSGV